MPRCCARWRRRRATPTPRRAEDTLVGVAGAYWFGVSALIEALVGLLPVERREGDA